MGLYLIELEGAERSFHYWRSTSAARHLADDPGGLGAGLAGAGMVHLSGITLAILPPADAVALTGLMRMKPKANDQVFGVFGDEVVRAH